MPFSGLPDVLEPPFDKLERADRGPSCSRDRRELHDFDPIGLPAGSAGLTWLGTKSPTGLHLRFTTIAMPACLRLEEPGDPLGRLVLPDDDLSQLHGAQQAGREGRFIAPGPDLFDEGLKRLGNDDCRRTATSGHRGRTSHLRRFFSSSSI